MADQFCGGSGCADSRSIIACGCSGEHHDDDDDSAIENEHNVVKGLYVSYSRKKAMSNLWALTLAHKATERRPLGTRTK